MSANNARISFKIDREITCFFFHYKRVRSPLFKRKDNIMDIISTICIVYAVISIISIVYAVCVMLDIF